MATLIFVCLKAGKIIDTPWDWYWCCLLLALELPQYLRLLVYWRAKR